MDSFTRFRLRAALRVLRRPCRCVDRAPARHLQALLQTLRRLRAPLRHHQALNLLLRRSGLGALLRLLGGLLALSCWDWRTK